MRFKYGNEPGNRKPSNVLDVRTCKSNGSVVLEGEKKRGHIL